MKKIENKQLEEGVLTEFQIYAPKSKYLGKRLSFRLAKISQKNWKEEVEYGYAYVCLEDQNLFTELINPGGQTGGGINTRDIRKFNEEHINYAFVKFLV